MATQEPPSPRACLGMLAAFVLTVVLLALCALRWRENGWGSLVWLAVFLAMFAIRAPHALRNHADVVTEARKGPAEMALLTGMFMAMIALPVIHLATGAFAFADYPLPEWAAWTGTAAQVPILWLFWRSHADLGRNWSPSLELREDHKLITRGIYRHIRHPMYAAIWISVLAQPLLIHNWLAGALVIPAFAAMWFIRVPNEEAMMQARFGSAWESYCLHAGRLLPRSGA